METILWAVHEKWERWEFSRAQTCVNQTNRPLIFRNEVITVMRKLTNNKSGAAEIIKATW